MKKRNYSLKNAEKAKLRKYFFDKLNTEEKAKLLILYPTLFTTGLPYYIGYPNIVWYAGQLTLNSTLGSNVNYILNTFQQGTTLKVPWMFTVSTFSNSVAGFSGLGVGVSNTVGANTPISTNPTGAGWGDSYFLNMPNHNPNTTTFASTTNNVQISNTPIGPTAVLETAGPNVCLTMKEFRSGTILWILTDLNGGSLGPSLNYPVTWTQINAWTNPATAVRSIAFIQFQVLGGMAGANLIMTPNNLIEYGS